MKKLIVTILPTPTKLITAVQLSVIEIKALLIAIGFICLISTNDMALAGETHEAHVHGVANLTLVSENGTLEVQFEAPAMSLLGFEHKPKTEQQRETVERTITILSSSTNVMSIAGANCVPNKVDVNIHGPAGQALTSTENQEQEHGHPESEQKQGDQKPSHSEVLATYRFTCVEGEKIGSISIALFEAFPNLERINSNWVTETQQGQSTLRPIASTIEFK